MPTFLDSTIISFYVSLLAIFGMIGFKAIEIRSGKKSWISRIAESTNHIFHNIFDAVKKLISFINKKTAIALIQWIAYYILSWARRVYIWAYRKAHAHGPSKRVIDMVRGKGEVSKNGGTSFYLKSISADSENKEVKK
jgi:hypothetical protein